MAKTTVSKELGEKYPALADLVGKTVDASVVQRAVSDAKVSKKDAKTAEKVAAAAKPAKVVAPKKAAAAKKSSKK